MKKLSPAGKRSWKNRKWEIEFNRPEKIQIAFIPRQGGRDFQPACSKQEPNSTRQRFPIETFRIDKLRTKKFYG